LATYFLHDVPEDLAHGLQDRGRAQLDESFDDPCTFDGWPDIPMRVVAGRDDRFFPLELQQRIARRRLGVDPEVVPGGHLVALSYPGELADALAGLLVTGHGLDD
jgi:pimeloyl-ACP methyl ester carboxylesterase